MSKDRINKVFRFLFWSFLAWILLRLIFFQVMQVPSDSMNNTLKEGDRILVNKAAYGPRLPFTLSLPFGDHLYLDWIRLPYLRLPGYADVQRNDVLVFNLPTELSLPVDQRRHYVKRCIGLPGDTLLIRKGIIYINGAPITESEGILNSGHPADSSAYSPAIFPHSSSIRWNLDHFGPFYIPQKGATITLSPETVLLYRNIIQSHEGNTLDVLGSQYFLNKQPATSFTFNMDYYFCLGDNRHNSVDSRYFGCVPEDHLIGKASLIPFLRK